MSRTPLTMIVAILLLTTTWWSGTAAAGTSGGRDSAKLSHTTTVGVHNAYEPGTFAYLAQALDAGTSLIELDVWPKPVGHGWLVNHLVPLGNHNNCVAADTTADLYRGPRNQDFAHCLDDIRLWLESHPGHDPLILKLELKPGFSARSGYGPADLDATLREHLGDLLYRPADLLAGHASLDAAARADAWPERSRLRGKVLAALIPGVPELLNPFDPLKTDVEYATHLSDLQRHGLIERAQMFPVVLNAATGDPRRRYADPALRRWFVVFDGYARDYLTGAIDTTWYDRNHYLLIMTEAHAPAPALDHRHPDPARARDRAIRLAAAHASVLTSDWSDPAILGTELPRGHPRR